MGFATGQSYGIGSGHGVSSVSTTTTGGPTVGNILVVWTWMEMASLTGITISDPSSNSYVTPANAFQYNSTSQVGVQISYSIITGTTGSGFSITAKSSPNNAFTGSVVAIEFSGGSTTGQPDAANGQQSNTGTSATPGSTTVAANDLVCYVAAIGSTANPQTINPPSGYTTAGQQTNGVTFCAGIGGYQINPTSPQNPSTGFPSGFDWASSLLALKIPATGGIVPKPLILRPNNYLLYAKIPSRQSGDVQWPGLLLSCPSFLRHSRRAQRKRSASFSPRRISA